MNAWMLFLLVIGVNFIIWGTIGLLRLIDERVIDRFRGGRGSHLAALPANGRLTTADVAVLMAAHNEELVIGQSLRSIARHVPLSNIHVVSDYSTDQTAEIVGRTGANILETSSNVGKAGALQEGISHFELADRFAAVMILDADTQLDDRYFEVALPLLDDPRVVAVAGCAQTRWPSREVGLFGSMLVAHRQRIYTLTQRLLKYGQTWRAVNATHIVPGFASIYRSSALRQIEVNPPGLVIEDFNMTFEVYAKRLGRIAFHPGATAYTQDPNRYGEYVQQTKRWSLGLWQTLRRYRPRPGLFSAMLTLLIAELLTSSVLLLGLTLTLVVLGVSEGLSLVGVAAGTSVAGTITSYLSIKAIALGVLLPDYLLTCWVALLEKRPRYLYLGLFFPLMRVTDAAIALYTLPRAWREQSNGRWVSPTRRAIVARETQQVVA